MIQLDWTESALASTDELLKLYKTCCLECSGSGMATYFSSEDEHTQEWVLAMGTAQVEPCPDCEGEGCLWFDLDGDEWIRRS